MTVASKEGATVTAALLVDAEPSTALVTTAEERGADLIGFGGLHDRSLADRLLGSTASEVTKHARCDVLIVRPEHEHGEPDVREDDVPGV